MNKLFSICIVLAGLAFSGCKGGVNIDNKPQEPTVCDPWPDDGAPSNVAYLNNGKIQIGIDLDRGGAIFHFSEAGLKKNLLNHYDEGRFIQQSFYGDLDGSVWNGTPWKYNPVQGGGAKGTKARILSNNSTADCLEIVTEPVLWSRDEPATDCRMIETITLDGEVARINFRFEYTGAKSHKATHQELPAVFIDYDYKNFVCYSGSKPWTGDELKMYEPAKLSDKGNSYEYYKEPWAAYVNDSEWGIGVMSPASTFCTLYRFGNGPGGSKASSCSYFAPVVEKALVTNLSFPYNVYITAGDVSDIRARFRKIIRK